MPNEREAEGFVRSVDSQTPQLRCAQQLPFQGSQGGFAARVAKLATPTGVLDDRGVHTFVTRAIVLLQYYCPLFLLCEWSILLFKRKF